MTRSSIKTGFSFGLTSGVITTLGLIVGLYSGTDSKIAVIGGILTIAIADSFSDALGIHISQESQEEASNKDIWLSTFSTFFSKLVFASSFIIPFLFFDLFQAVVISIVWGLLVLSLFSVFIAKQREKDVLKVVAEHLVIGLVVILITYLLGDWIAVYFQ
jgi:vacuolar iron transporter family protein